MINLPLLIKIQKRNIQTEMGPITLKYIQPPKKGREKLVDLIENAPHLKELIKLFDGDVHKRVILQCDDINAGITTVGKIACCMKEDSDITLIETDIDFDDDDIYFEDDFSSEETPTVNTDEENYFIAYESEFDLYCNSIGETSSMEQMMSKSPKIDYTNFKNLIFVCDGLFTLTNRSINFIQSFEGSIAIVIPRINKNTAALNQLIFESDFELVHIDKPSNKYLANQFKDLAIGKGFTFSKDLNIEQKMEELRHFRATRFQEYDLSIYLDKCIKLSKGKSSEFKTLIPLKNNIESINTHVSMSDIIGLDDIKGKVYQELYRNIHFAQRLAEGNPVINSYKHVAFVGNPGTCKTTMARIMAKLYLENNIISNGFYEFGREDIVGRYLGETAQKVSKIFKMGEGGVVFLDEIGAIISGDGADLYGEEALNTIIRYMENQPNTMVIMATYPNEMQKILSINPGLQSRLSKVISFPDYKNEELLNIFTHIAEKSGYVLEDGYEELIIDYFNKIRNNDNFGNGRESRKLFENIISNLSVELIKNNSSNIDFITISSIKNGIDDLTKSFIPEKKRYSIGFATSKV